MLAYQVTVNGNLVATVGVRQGVISAIANWLCLPSDTTSESPDGWHAGFSVAGLDDVTSEHLKWFRCDVRVGDEIGIKLVEAETVDEPTERGPRPEKTPASATKA